MKTVRGPSWVLNVTLLICLLNMPCLLLALPEGGIKQLLAGTGTPHDIKFSPDGSTLAIAGELGIVLYETEDYTPIGLLESHKSHVAAIAFSSDGKLLASASWDATIKLWNVAMKTELHTFKGHSEPVNAVVFAPDAKVLASGSADKTIKLWDVSEQREIATFDGHNGPVKNVVFFSDGERLASGSQDGTVKLWSVPGIHVTKTLEEHNNWVSAIALSPDGQTFVSGSRDKTVWVGEIPNGAEIARLRWTEHYANDITFSSDGRILALASTDHTVRLRSRTNLTADLETLRGHSGSVTALAFAPDPAHGILASVSEDQTVILWDLAYFGIEIRQTADTAIGKTTNTESDGKKVAPVLSILGDPSFSKEELKAGETTTLSLYVQNSGDADADQVQIIFSSDAASKNLLSVTRPTALKIPKNNQKLVEIPIHADRTLSDGTSQIQIQLHDTEYDVQSQIVTVPIRTVALPADVAPPEGPPQLVLAGWNLNDITPNLPQENKNRTVELKFYVENQGDSTAENVKVQVSHNHSGLAMFDGEPIKLKSIDPGNNRAASYTYLVTNDFKETEFKFKIEGTGSEGSGFNESKSFLTERVLRTKPRSNSENSTDVPDNTQDVDVKDIDVRKNIPPAKVPNRSNAFAYVVGISEYEDFPKLKYAENDAESVRQYLAKTLGYKEDNILPEKNKRITVTRLKEMLSEESELSKAVDTTPNAEVFIYFSGHGAPRTFAETKEPGYFLVPFECEQKRVDEETAYSLMKFEEDLKTFYEKHRCERLIVVLDACFSGYSKGDGEALSTAKSPRIPIVTKKKNPLEGTNTIKISSSSRQQQSYEWREKKHSFFTYFFLSGLKGDADQDKNKSITVTELENHLKKEVPHWTNRKAESKQTPVLKIYNDDLKHHPIVKFADSPPQ